MNNDSLENIIQKQTTSNDAVNQFGVAQTPFHSHNGSDSPSISFQDITNRDEYLSIIIPGTLAQTATNYGVVFIAPYNCLFKGATEVHTTAATVGTPTLQVEKLTGTTATGSGVNLLFNSFNLAVAANTVQTAALANIQNSNFNLKTGDRLGLSVSGTLTTLSHVVVVLQLMY